MAPMKRLVPLALALIAIVTPSPAQAADPEITLSVNQVIEPSPEQPGGVSQSDGLGSIHGIGSIIGLAASCTGAACDYTRPAEWHLMRGGKDTIIRTSTLGDFLSDSHDWDTNDDIKREFPTVDTKRIGKLFYRIVLPAWGDYPAVEDSSETFDIRKATSVRISGGPGVWDPEGYGSGIKHYCVRRSGNQTPVMILRVSPRGVKRSGIVQFVENDRVVARSISTDKRGLMRIPVPETGSETRGLRVWATRTYAGFAVQFDPCPTT